MSDPSHAKAKYLDTPKQLMKRFHSRKTESQKVKEETKSCLRVDMKAGYSYKVLGFCRKFKVAQVSPPPDVKEAFATFADGLDYMSADQLCRFLVEHQGQLDCSVPLAEQIIEQVLQKRRSLTPKESVSNPRLGLEDFFYFLFLDDLNGPLKSQVHHDMTAPLSHYFIYTGHNSYLTGNQLSSDCSEVPIIKALRRGVKVIELDLWPNSAKDDILVLHGRTFTSPVTLIKCLKSIKEHAFEKSPYPVIITLEDHLTADLQAKVAELVTATFGEMLYCHHAECLSEFPSPEALKYKVVISTKPPKEYLQTKQTKENVKNSQSEKGSCEEEVSGKETSEHAASPEADPTSESDQEDEEDINAGDFKSFQQGAPEYKRLITIHAGKPKGSLKEALKIEADKVRRLSLSEQGLEKAVTSHGTDVVRFTQKNILRVYPKGTRVTSSNFRPHVGWMYGAQMVAFNMQGYGKSLWMMHGMFRANGGCGYVKKPEFLIHKDLPAFDPWKILPPKTTLKVKVYMGDGWSSDFSLTHFDTYSPPDFYTKVYIIGVPADAVKKKTRIIEDNWEPVWDEEFKFPLTVPELALLRIEVRDHDRSEKDDFGGQTCLPVSELKPGIRAVPLHDRKGEKFNSVKLLMRFQFV